MTTTTGEAQPGSATVALVERLFGATIGTLEIASVHLGGRLGFYRALADGGDATPAQLAARTGTAERYVREWLEQQAVAGFLSVDDPKAEPGERRYGLPAAHRPVFADELVITEATAAVHVKHILHKLGLGSRVQVAAWAARHGDAPAPTG